MNDPRFRFTPERQPLFNLPGVVVGLLAVLVAIEAARAYVLDPDTDFALVLALAFIPARVTEPAVIGVLPGGAGAGVWSFLTYAFLHADWSHLLFNGLWLAAFGSPVAWRFGAARFLAFSALGAVAGAALHLAVHPQSMIPMVGASATVSALMAGATRFVFSAGGPLRTFQGAGPEVFRRPAPPLGLALRDSRVAIFLAVWFGLNLVFGLLPDGGGLASGAIAWEAHVGGFLAGLLLFPLFDPVPRPAV